MLTSGLHPVESGTGSKSDLAAFRRRLHEMTGVEPTDEHIHQLGSGQPGHPVVVHLGGWAGTTPVLMATGDVHSNRSVFQQDGKLYLNNNTLSIDKRNKVKGIDLFRRQIDAARALRFHGMQTQAAGNLVNNYADDRFNGYYTWPRFGYSGRIHRGIIEDLPEDVQQKLREKSDPHGMIDIQDLFEHPEGPHLWELKGHDFDAWFDPHEGSRNSKALENYLAIRDTPEYRERRKREIEKAKEIAQRLATEGHRMYLSRAASSKKSQHTIGEQLGALLYARSRYARRQVPQRLGAALVDTSSRLVDLHDAAREQRHRGGKVNTREIDGAFLPRNAGSDKLRQVLLGIFDG